MIKKFFKFILLLTFITVAVAALSFYVAATKWRSPSDAELDVRPGSSLRSIAAQMHDVGIIRVPKLFELYVRSKGAGGKMKAGMYDFPAGMNMIEAAGKLISGDVRAYDFTIIEGWNIEDIAKALVGKPFIVNDDMPAEFRRLARDESLMDELGVFEVPSFEGFLFPDTYRFDYPLSAKDFIRRLVSRFDEVWRSVPSGGDGRSRNEIITLASIVEKETGIPSERALVAGVFMNRLLKGIALQSDPTIIYGLSNFDGNIRKPDISNPHPYNTYVHRGLPPGPICNPGRASIIAAMNPEKTEYFYFVSMNDGSHHFSKDLAEHLKAVRRYQTFRSDK
ncbi:MAG: putative aminodeoxychorismate lyase [bacterium ADurb.Bin270]|nr:MAG: putative aminodeoxychorismate lyase [bacterium ADurb.Bin270]HQG13122.1 endolytic transglycosylase MltG [bacterium]HQH80075.1 endolytic transglycosylase MltG [bacterium]